MRTFTIKVKYNVGDKVWAMVDNHPAYLQITQIVIFGSREDISGATPDFGKVSYFLNNDDFKSYTEEEVCDTFEELRDKVFSEDIKEIKGYE